MKPSPSFARVGEALLVAVGQLEHAVGVQAHDPEALRRVSAVELREQRRRPHAGRAAREPEVQQVRLAGEVGRGERLAVVARDGEGGRRAALPAGDRALEQLAEARVGEHSSTSTIMDLAVHAGCAYEVRHARVGLHDAQHQRRPRPAPGSANCSEISASVGGRPAGLLVLRQEERQLEEGVEQAVEHRALRVAREDLVVELGHHHALAGADVVLQVLDDLDLGRRGRRLAPAATGKRRDQQRPAARRSVARSSCRILSSDGGRGAAASPPRNYTGRAMAASRPGSCAARAARAPRPTSTPRRAAPSCRSGWPSTTRSAS